MAKAYKCDLCGCYVDGCYGVSGFDIYPRELREKGIDKDKRCEVKEVCEECHGKIKNVVIELFRKAKSATAER